MAEVGEKDELLDQGHTRDVELKEEVKGIKHVNGLNAEKAGYNKVARFIAQGAMQDSQKEQEVFVTT